MPSNFSVLTLPSGVLSLGVTYAFTVLVHSNDMNRKNSTTVNIIASDYGGASVSISYPYKKFNPSMKLVLNSLISTNNTVDSTWTVKNSTGSILSLNTLTDQNKLFTIADFKPSINYPLSVSGGIFVGGQGYTFRLSVVTQTSSTITYSEITLTANSPPTSGYISSSPTYGLALSTLFTIMSPSWTSSIENFPLSYSFSYRLNNVSTYLSISASSFRAAVNTSLPAGLQSELYDVTLQVQVTDIYFSFSTNTTSVRVNNSSNNNLLQILNNSVNHGIAIGDNNLIISTVNNVSYRTQIFLYT